MKLLKVHVHNYRHLKDVSLTFEPDLYPQVFAIASENGGGKSTLLQLIFTFLHCAPNPNLHKFVINAIQHMNGSLEEWDETIHQIIDINLLDKDNNKISISYFLYPVNSLAPENIENPCGIAIHFMFECQLLQDTLTSLYSKKKTLLSSLNNLNSMELNADIRTRKKKIQDSLRVIEKQINNSQETLDAMAINPYSHKFQEENLESLFFLKLPNYHGNVSNYSLCCKVETDTYINANDILINLANHIFLAGQTTQPYIFLSNENIRDMFNSDKNYELTLEKARLEIGNLYNFNAFAINEIIAAFKTALEEDAKSMIQNSYYGSSFSDLTKELKFILGGNKEILPTPECDGLTIRYYLDDKNYTELSLGELSHGELKRVCLYSWIRHTKASQSIVLIDEIENGLHPDWQYQIVKDLQEWGDNQYILATHSFYLCEALTPRHVKELTPKMSQPILHK